MADVDIDPFGEHGPFEPGGAERPHESRPEEPTDEHIPLTPVGGGGSTWDPRGSWAHGNQKEVNRKRHLEESLKEPN